MSETSPIPMRSLKLSGWQEHDASHDHRHLDPVQTQGAVVKRRGPPFKAPEVRKSVQCNVRMTKATA